MLIIKQQRYNVLQHLCVIETVQVGLYDFLNKSSVSGQTVEVVIKRYSASRNDDRTSKQLCVWPSVTVDRQCQRRRVDAAGARQVVAVT